MSSNRLAVVTGAAGFIGGHCSRALLEDGWAVRGVDNFEPFYDRSIKETTIRELSRLSRFSLVEADLRDGPAMQSAVAGADVVIHLAARAGVRPSLEQPELYTSINVLGTATLLEACRRAGLRRLVFGSSSSVYGDSTPVPFHEDAPATDPISPYAATKRAGELLCGVYVQAHRFRIAALRLFTVYGPRQRPDLAIHRFTKLLSEGQPIEQYGDGSSERDYTHVDDIVRGIRGALDWVASDPPAFEIVNLGEARTVRLDYLIELIGKTMGVTPQIRTTPMPPGDVRRTFADITKARRLLGYDPQVSIEEGIQKFVRWYQGGIS
ncbi:MAG: NAD-dependent epimerase/dehydratase family protein [Gemmatimonadales bacterium]|nr:NAD-dependent epimerase/dehydratase family protein [Gemmatimonadales bacterium]